MSILDLTQGRANQKWRTRQALLAAAGQMVREGRSPTVAEVADFARVSRTTAYRYFSSQQALLDWGAFESLVSQDLQQLNAMAANGSGTPEERLDAIVQYDHRMTVEKEPGFRAMLRASLNQPSSDETGAPRRPAHRLDWFATVLSQLHSRLGDQAFNRLLAAVSLCTGIESLIVLCDVCDLSPDDAEEVKRWAAQALVKQALAEAESDVG